MSKAAHESLPPTSVTSEADIVAMPAETESLLVRRLTDSKAACLRRLTGLRVLLTDGSNGLTDAGLEMVAVLPALEVLDLEWSAITDVGLSHLHQARALRWLDLTGCSRVSAAGVTALRHALPNCEIEP